ncbi:ATP-dependent DNA helicase sgs1 [Puccinia graminis f. sp. tritici]|nr:ATP-dependent DNA helicase sgs1 [Puccinia graminis f. sp. tritici]
MYRLRGTSETNTIATGELEPSVTDKEATSDQPNEPSDPIDSSTAKRPRKNAVSPEILRQRELAAAEKKKAKQQRLELQIQEQEAKARRAAWHLQNMNEIKKAHGLL